jgi:N-acetyl-gamma-glutamyl-phosphate reductase
MFLTGLVDIMHKPKIFIDGQAGTTGLQIHELLARDGAMAIDILTLNESERKDEKARRRLLNEADVAILCLPDDAARQAVSWIENDRVRVLDASSAHRVAPKWAYGFPELRKDQAGRIAKARLVSNPGCYATGAIALLSPLVQAGLLAPATPITINAISGYSGGGKKMIANYEDPSNHMPAFRPYGLDFQHKHIKEMQKHSALSHAPLFSPAVGLFRQGMMVQIPMQLWALPSATTPGDLHAALSNHYMHSSVVKVAPFIEGAAANEITLDPEKFNDTNFLEISVFGDPVSKQAVLIACFDNLGKGASGAAIQNLRLMLGFDA